MNRPRGGDTTATGPTPALRKFILRMARNYHAPDPEEIAQIVMLDMIEKPFLSSPQNTGALVQRIKHRTLTQLRTCRRRAKYEQAYAVKEYGHMLDGTDEATDTRIDAWEGADWS